MKITLVLGTLLLAATLALASTGAEIHCWFLGMGGEPSTSATYSLRSYTGPSVVGVSTSSSHILVHGPVLCYPATVTAVEDPSASLPKSVRLHQNAPNPFNPRTTIRYDLPEDAPKVELRVYDLSGRLVRTLVDGPQSAGSKSVVWAGRDEAGRFVATGVYLYVLATPAYRFTRKMALVK
jgi:hypothetical protein